MIIRLAFCACHSIAEFLKPIRTRHLRSQAWRDAGMRHFRHFRQQPASAHLRPSVIGRRLSDNDQAGIVHLNYLGCLDIYCLTYRVVLLLDSVDKCLLGYIGILPLYS